MSDTMELNKAAQARSDDASQAAREKCAAAMAGGVYQRQGALKHAMIFDAERTAMFLARFVTNNDKAAFTAGICAIHGAYARAAIDREFDKSKLIGSGTFGGIG